MTNIYSKIKKDILESETVQQYVKLVQELSYFKDITTYDKNGINIVFNSVDIEFEISFNQPEMSNASLEIMKYEIKNKNDADSQVEKKYNFNINTKEGLCSLCLIARNNEVSLFSANYLKELKLPKEKNLSIEYYYSLENNKNTMDCSFFNHANNHAFELEFKESGLFVNNFFDSRESNSLDNKVEKIFKDVENNARYEVSNRCLELFLYDKKFSNEEKDLYTLSYDFNNDMFEILETFSHDFFKKTITHKPTNNRTKKI